MLISEVAEIISAEIVCAKKQPEAKEVPTELEIISINKIELATEGELSFIANPMYEKFEATTNASALIVSKKFQPKREDLCYLRVNDPYNAFVDLMIKFYGNNKFVGQIHPTAVIHSTAQVSGSAVIGANVVIGENCTIGKSTYIYPNVVIYDNTIIGDRCIIHAGAVIGSDGFGYAPTFDKEAQKKVWKKIPHIGRVVLENNVEIGANTTIDRGTIGETRICDGVKIDNQVQIAHNVIINEGSAVAGQSAIAGSAVIGKNNMLAGQSGIIGHVTTCDNVVVLGMSGVSKDITKEGKYYGAPAREYLSVLREEAAIRQLPNLLKEIEEMKKEIEEMKKRN